MTVSVVGIAEIKTLVYNNMHMSTPEVESTITLFQTDRKDCISVKPPLQDFEEDAMGWTGSEERLFIEPSTTGDTTTLWMWKPKEFNSDVILPGELTMKDMQKFVLKSFAYQVQLLRELQEHTVTVEDNL